MIKSLLYYVALLLFVIYNCNTPVSSLRSFIPTSVGKYLLGFPAFIVVTTILVVYPILTGKEFSIFKTETTSTNIFQPDGTDSTNRATVVIDDSGEIILEKSSDVNQKFANLVQDLKSDVNKIDAGLKETNKRMLHIKDLSFSSDRAVMDSLTNAGSTWVNPLSCGNPHGNEGNCPGGEHYARWDKRDCHGGLNRFPDWTFPNDPNFPGKFCYKRGTCFDTREGKTRIRCPEGTMITEVTINDKARGGNVGACACMTAHGTFGSGFQKPWEDWYKEQQQANRNGPQNKTYGKTLEGQARSWTDNNFYPTA